MKVSFRSKLMISYLALLVVMSATVYLYLNSSLQQAIISSQQENLANEARLTAAMAIREPGLLVTVASALASEAGRSLSARVTIIDPSGRVIGDSEVADARLAGLENHLDRPEIKAALQTGKGSAIRYSATLHTNMLYVAVPLTVGSRPGGFVRLALPLAIVDKELKEMHTILGIGLLVAFFLSMILSDILARITSKRLQMVAAVASGIGEGDYSQRLPDTWHDELGDLGRVINDMAGRIDQSIAVRRDFVANVSHELRTPLSVISGYAETIVANRLVETDPERASRFVETIHAHSGRLTRLIEDILQLSRLEGDAAGISLRIWRLEDLLRSVVQLFEQPMEERGVRLVMRETAGQLLLVDRERLEQVFVNLLDNALKNTPPGGEIAITARTIDDRVEIILSDTGIGIPSEHLARIFERFYRVDPARSRNQGGTGLGLAITKHIIQLHGGTIDVASKPGLGTTFKILLPSGRRQDV